MKIINHFKQLLNNKEGSFAILFVILAFTAITIITGFTDMLYKTYTLNEIQSIMDTAGANALQSGVDQTKLRLEIFDINENFVKNTYVNSVNSSITISNSVREFILTKGNVNFSTWQDDWGLGTSSKLRPQAMIDSVAKVKVKSSLIFDTIPGIAETFYNSRSNSNFTITYNGITSDGNTELIIRSVTRIVYR
ncbi:MAG: hypothetical protein K0R54_67 [Clostridiaceae bacterium]|jgi:Flp pilus assembly protein TadG|nr:hypothetical protein [Clostridiaceae bacterium]